MAVTPDRFPGPLLESDEIQLAAQAADPDVSGAVRFNGSEFRLRDAAGVFNPRTGGSGITAEEHRNLDQLVHALAENCYEEYTYNGPRVATCIVWTDAAKTKKIREEQYTYSGSKVSSILVIQYNSAGTEFERLTETYAYAGNKVTSVTAVRSVP